jgi:hypothetical protein
MASKIGRFVPLAISGAVLIGFLINFKFFKFDFIQHYRYGAGAIYDSFGNSLQAPFIANLYLHLSWILLFVGGILLFFLHNRLTMRGFMVISILMLLVDLLRPIVTNVVVYFQFLIPLEYVVIPTFKGQLLGVGVGGFEWRNDKAATIQTLLWGIVLSSLLLVNLILAFRHKQDPAYAERKQRQRDILNQQAQARQSAFATQQQAQVARPMSTPTPLQPQGYSVSMTQELERLQQMYNSGALTEEEFTVAKKRVLGN